MWGWGFAFIFTFFTYFWHAITLSCFFDFVTYMVHNLIELFFFFIAEIPTIPLNVIVSAERLSRRGNTTIRVAWMQPQNFHQFDIDRYDITVTSTSGIQNMTTACGDCTNTVITVSENPNNVRMNTTFSATIAAVNLCRETGPTGTASYTLSKLPLLNEKEYQFDK